MVSPLRPFKCPFMFVVKQDGKHRFVNLTRVCCWDRDRSGTKLIFSWFVCQKKCHFCVRMFGRYVSYEKWVQYVSWWWWGERIGPNLWSVHFSHKNEWTQDCFLSPKGAGPRRKNMWHWYRKWTFSETSRILLLTVSGISFYKPKIREPPFHWSELRKHHVFSSGWENSALTLNVNSITLINTVETLIWYIWNMWFPETFKANMFPGDGAAQVDLPSGDFAATSLFSLSDVTVDTKRSVDGNQKDVSLLYQTLFLKQHVTASGWLTGDVQWELLDLLLAGFRDHPAEVLARVLSR